MGATATSSTHLHLCSSTLPFLSLIWVNLPMLLFKDSPLFCAADAISTCLFKDFSPTFIRFSPASSKFPSLQNYSQQHTKIL